MSYHAYIEIVFQSRTPSGVGDAPMMPTIVNYYNIYNRWVAIDTSFCSAEQSESLVFGLYNSSNYNLDFSTRGFINQFWNGLARSNQ